MMSFRQRFSMASGRSFLERPAPS